MTKAHRQNKSRRVERASGIEKCYRDDKPDESLYQITSGHDCAGFYYLDSGDLLFLLGRLERHCGKAQAEAVVSYNLAVVPVFLPAGLTTVFA